MQITIVRYYPLAKKSGNVRGTLHIRIEELGINLRGILVIKTNSGPWRFFLPQSFGIDISTGERVRYPVFTFMDEAKGKELIEAIQVAGRAFMANLPIIAP